MSGGPRTAREALFAELLGDVDGLLKRVEPCLRRLPVPKESSPAP